MQFGFDRKFLAAAGLALAGYAVLIGVGLQTAQRLRNDLVEVDHARDVQLQTRSVWLTLLEMETSQRGYLLTLDPAYLDPYRAGVARLPQQLQALDALTRSRPAEAGAYERLRSRVDTQSAGLAAMIALADRQGAAAALARLRDGSGKAAMDDLRVQLARMEGAEAEALGRYPAAQRISVEATAAVGGVLVAALTLVFGALYLLVRRERQARERAAGAQAAARQDLERHVGQRTRELEWALHSLALSEARLRGIFESATDAILTADASLCVAEANPAAAVLFRCELAQMVGSPLDRFIPERFRARHRHDIQTFASGEVSARQMGRSRQVMGLRADGEEFPLGASISHLSVDGERHYTVILRDLSERLRIESDLLASKARLDAALASMNDAVFISDREGRFVEFNDAFATFHRYAGKHECRATLAEYSEVLEVFTVQGASVPPDRWPAPRALGGETAANAEFRLRRKDSGEAWIGSYSYAPIRSGDGAIVGAVVTARDITAMRQAQAELEVSHADLQRLIAAQDRVQEDERKRIARELHDDLQQSLAAIRMDAVAVVERLASERGELQPLLARIDALVAAAMASTRRIVNDLRPEMLEDLGLLPALEALCMQFAERTGIVCEVDADEGAGDRLLALPAAATCLFRIVQESLNNVAKHAQARSVDVRLLCGADGGIVLGVSDDGRGMTTGQPRKAQSFGLLGMAERVRAIGGELRLGSRPGAGTTVEVFVPIHGRGENGRALS